ncbi:PIN domain-containing protein [Aquincola sp. S2]|uniref:PIN domain-containing protein n=1 Tax=Pseudaquabacterium terrae TaxID=2732868 RepID=A0ABX2ET49_9BURK|nr:PIN domain-containing protein [Aquabacterium terrae]NRF71927.1 PIN domain-containing protein [Aquabacterium terrae]
MSAVFVDTNVLIYSEDRADAVKQRRAIDWLRVLWLSRRGRVSTQVLSEFYVNATRKLRPAMPAGDARAEVRRYQRWQPWSIDHATVETAWAVESRFGLSYWDALIVAAARAQGCRFLLTEDLQHGQQIDSVQILNPFLVGPEVLDAPTA